MKDFNKFISDAVTSALPTKWRQISSEKLLKRGSIKISNAFNSSNFNSESKLINVLSIPKEFELTESSEKNLFELRKYILSKDSMLIVCSEQENSKYSNDFDIFISEDFDLQHQNFAYFPCYADKEFKTTIDGTNYEPISRTIKDIWRQELVFNGPLCGMNLIYIELMRDECWKCNQEMNTVTGIVFPDRPIDDTTNTSWLYYNQLLSLSKLTSESAKKVQEKLTNSLLRTTQILLLCSTDLATRLKINIGLLLALIAIL